jgi:hypothetical protein
MQISQHAPHVFYTFIILPCKYLTKSNFPLNLQKSTLQIYKVLCIQIRLPFLPTTEFWHLSNTYLFLENEFRQFQI